MVNVGAKCANNDFLDNLANRVGKFFLLMKLDSHEKMNLLFQDITFSTIYFSFPGDKIEASSYFLGLTSDGEDLIKLKETERWPAFLRRRLRQIPVVPPQKTPNSVTRSRYGATRLQLQSSMLFHRLGLSIRRMGTCFSVQQSRKQQHLNKNKLIWLKQA
ncbi:hypothetical protein PRUPE_2G101100 [Prunus persica]|uniref:Uncharacterized protein n=1 Tax=Prunus persica TaxID=3760 RepID=A0A251QF24_PRUPE|nr:hypothetical protein PRUPE_2G101100 [Prunus persica]